MNTSRTTPDSDDGHHLKPAGDWGSALPASYAAGQQHPEHSMPPLTPPGHNVSDDWSVLIPGYRRFLPVKMALGLLSFAVSGAVIGLTKVHADQAATFTNPDVPARSDSLTYGTAALAMIWVFFEFLVLFSHNYKAGRRGIHPGGHVIFEATIFAVAIVSAIDNIRFLQAGIDQALVPDTPPEEEEKLVELVRAMAATVLTVGAIHFVLFCFACVEIVFINSAKRDPPIPMHALPRGRLSMATEPPPEFLARIPSEERAVVVVGLDSQSKGS
ncbi:hypothetical protein QBC47DRAFT_445561 [Echria macrotheca]|uniref:Uncharacterized protein n=1 Tax=Echria macrotheca TaxID=438768 RepID=A0AAJ0BCE7_9PEZI|nr:hypothetical protein QBC47DRAFT_445561 [Echria macrotheca]